MSTRLHEPHRSSCIESDFGIEIAKAFRTMIDQNIDRVNWRAHLAQDYRPLLSVLLDGEWDKVGAVAQDTDRDTDSELSMHDLCLLAEHWGSALIPLPLIPTIALRRAGW